MSVIPEQARQNDPFLSCYVCYTVFYQLAIFWVHDGIVGHDGIMVHDSIVGHGGA